MTLPRPGRRPIQKSTKVPVRGPTVEQTQANRKLAMQIYQTQLGDLARDLWKLPIQKPTSRFATFLQWYREHVSTKKRGHERELEIFPTLAAAFGALELQAIDRTVVQEWMTERLKTVSANTVNREVDLLKSILQAAVPKYFQVSPIYGMKRLRVIKPKRRLLTEAEEKRLLPALALDDRVLFMMGLDSLPRQGDLLDLRWSDIDLKRCTAYISDPKDPNQGEPLDVPLSTRVIKDLRRMKPMGKYVFQRRRRAKTARDRRRTIQQLLQRACKKAKIPYGRTNGGITFHWATRRTGATRMLRGGTPLGAVQKVGNWKHANVVLEIYNEAMPQDVKRAVEVPGKRAKRTTGA
jgi:integrase